jgi:hypothetical protein
MIPELAQTLSSHEKQHALGYLMFLKSKRCRKIEAHGFAVCCKQRGCITREDAASPTVFNAAL